MRSVSALCASGCSLALPPLQLALARNEDNDGDVEMTTTATITHSSTTTPPPTAHFPNTPISLFVRAQNGRTLSGGVAGIKRKISGAMTAGDDAGTPDNHHTNQTWLRRMSSTMSRSRDSSRASTSRPGSSAVSQSNGSLAFSNAGSSTPILPYSASPSLPPNKLVKRAASMRSDDSSPNYALSSRLPVPVFRRPATSHERSATLREQRSVSLPLGRPESQPVSQIHAKWQHFWTPRTSAENILPGKRGHSTSIPNPIKRVYPHPMRRHTPVLISAREHVRLADVEIDDTLSIDSHSIGTSMVSLRDRAATSPIPIQAQRLEQEQAEPKRSFSIGDLLSTGPQQLLKRPSFSKRKSSTNKLARKPGRRTVSSPTPVMGNMFSTKAGDDSERPTKRRDFTDPRVSERSVYSSSSSRAEPSRPNDMDLRLGADTPLSQPSPWDDSSFEDKSVHIRTPSLLDQAQPTFATNNGLPGRHIRPSNAQSDAPSSVESDNEPRSVGDASTDYQSDAVWDSFPTRTTRSSLGRRGPPIDTIFDDSPPMFSSGRSTKLKDFLSDGSQPDSEHALRLRHSTIEEEGSMTSTPPRNSQDQRFPSSPTQVREPQTLFLSSPPTSSRMPDPDEMDWDVPDEEALPQPMLTDKDQPSAPAVPNPPVSMRLNPLLRSQDSSSATSTPRRNGAVERASIFDWSETQPSSANNNSSPPRPKTVHGKKEPDNRGSRSAGRRAPSGMHARSHSVPVVPDVDGKRSTVVANKFGTWGVGSKAVTEDWNEDFDFEDEPAQPGAAQAEERRIDSGHEMFVPKSIREQQENVVANIGLLREWGLLIEELKELRIRASALNMLDGPHAMAWSEVDAMIELADQETAEHTLEPRTTPPSSPGFDFTAFDEPQPVLANTSRPRRPSIRLSESTTQDARQRHAVSAERMLPTMSSPARPRKDSEAVARSVIEAIQSRRNIPTAVDTEQHTSSKVPFDTGTLRHIVPYVRDLKRKVKEALREAEGLYSSPHRRHSPDKDIAGQRNRNEPPFRTMFDSPTASTAAETQLPRRQRAATNHDESDLQPSPQSDDLTMRIDRMNFDN